MNLDRGTAVIGPVLVIGTGLIGTSIALALKRAGVEVFLEDTDPS
ncbi:MAG: prephenate dehydrogenase, partial [Actinobacteria bacterium]|nr:prephenate dehydrogenase [Actinomycetota bacterium]